MKNRIRALMLLAAAAAVAASCSTIEKINAPALAPGRADFSVVAAVGSSITAGFQSGGLVDRHQTHSYVSLFAQQVGARTLDLPLVDGAGDPPLLELKHLYPPPIQVGRISAPAGNYTNDGPPAYHNMGVPGALLKDLTDASGYASNPYFATIQRNRGTIARQVADSLNPKPTFLFFEYGTGDLLRPALQGITTNLLSVVDFETFFSNGLDTLAALLPNAKLAVLNVPDITSFPFFTTLSNKQLDANGQPVLDANGKPKFLLGPQLDAAGNPLPLTANDLVLLSAQDSVARGNGYPENAFSYLSGSPVKGTGDGLTNAQVLSGSEAATLQDRAHKFNSAIEAISQSTVKPRDYAIVDLDGLIRRAKSPGIEIRRVLYTTRFVTGGLFGLDGVFPNDLAHALLCNEVIRAVNAKFGAGIQPVDPLRFATLTSSRAGVAPEAGGPIPAR